MDLYEIVNVYTNRWVVLLPQARDERGFVSFWDVLDESNDLYEAKNLQKLYQNRGDIGVVLYNTDEPEDGSEASIVAEFFRVYYGR